MIRHDQMSVLRDVEIAVEGDAAANERLHLLEERSGIDDDAASDDASATRVQDSRRDRLEHELLLADHDGVSGIVAALVANRHVCIGRQHVDHLALALVAPLGAHHHDVGHGYTPRRPGKYGAGSASNARVATVSSWPVSRSRRRTRSSPPAAAPASPMISAQCTRCWRA